jgi:hypothetical protein
MGLFRDTFYRYKAAVELQLNKAALNPCSTRAGGSRT